jgi:DNA mismatch repair protein MutS2
MIDPHSLRVLEFDAVLEMLASQAASLLGQQLSSQLLPLTDLTEIRQSLEETEEMRHAIHFGGDPPLAGLMDIRPHLDRSLLEGAVLLPSELKEVEKVLQAMGQLKSYFKPLAPTFPLLRPYFSSILPQPQLRERIGKSIGEEGEILDEASLRLKRIRLDALELRQRIREKLQGFLASPTHQKVIAESLITIRNDRYVIPVKPNFKTALKGFIQDQSASGQTLFLEPLSLVDDNNRLKQLRLEEEKEVRKILADLTESLKKKVHEIQPGVKAMTALDLLYAKARLAERMNAKKPSVREDGRVRLQEARHPLLIKKMEVGNGKSMEGSEIVPIDLSMGDPYKILVITGPNMGGKTVALKTTGLLCLMAMAGLHIPASSDSEISLFSQIFADIGEEQDIERSLSTFSSHIRQIAKILREADDGSLVLLDELGSGTDPLEGSALGISVLEELCRRGTITLATTHQDAIKAYAFSHPAMENASVEFDLDTLRPRYKLSMGIPGRSYALDIALQLGISEEIIASARGRMNSEVIAWEAMLKQIQESGLLAEESKRRAEEEANRASLLRREYEALREEVRGKKKAIEEEGKKRIEDLVAQGRREIEAAIRELRVKEASRESIREGHRILAGLAQEADQAQSNEREEGAEEVVGSPERISWSKGQRVWVRGLRQEGVLLQDVDDQGMVEVQIKVGKLRVSSNELEPARTPIRKDVSAPVSFLHPERGTETSVEIPAELNLIGSRREEAISAAERYLDVAFLAGLKEVRIIHGKGTGILRKGIEEMLSTHAMVEDFHLAPIQQGGAGATIVRIKS